MNKGISLILTLVASGLLFLAGCIGSSVDKPAKGNDPQKSPQVSATPEQKNPKIQAALDKLDPEDRKLAEAQEWCAVEDESPLGGMGKPLKVMVKGQPVFLCCKGCEKTAQADPEKTLAKVEELKAKHSKSAK
jgi:hypothetical protein